MKATKWCGRSWLAHVRIVKSDWLNVWKSGGARRFELSCAVDFKREGCATHVNANGLWFQIACTCKEGLRGRIKGPREYSSVVSVMGKRRSKNPQHPERVAILIFSLTTFQREWKSNSRMCPLWLIKQMTMWVSVWMDVIFTMISANRPCVDQDASYVVMESIPVRCKIMKMRFS